MQLCPEISAKMGTGTGPVSCPIPFFNGRSWESIKVGILNLWYNWAPHKFYQMKTMGFFFKSNICETSLSGHPCMLRTCPDYRYNKKWAHWAAIIKAWKAIEIWCKEWKKITLMLAEWLLQKLVSNSSNDGWSQEKLTDLRTAPQKNLKSSIACDIVLKYTTSTPLYSVLECLQLTSFKLYIRKCKKPCSLLTFSKNLLNGIHY